MSADGRGPVRKALLYARTLRHLRPRQVLGQLRDRLPRAMPASGPVPRRRQTSGPWVAGVSKHKGYLGANRFRFLNVEDDFDSAGGWFGSKHSYLWYYNLNYFEWLNAPDAEAETGWIRKWIAECPVGSGRSWDPYPVSLRIIQWIRFLMEHGPVSDEAIDASLAVQARWLRGRLETRLLANHYLVNGIALVFAGSYFAGKEADGWMAAGARIVGEEVREQILADGGHFERSVMYHSLVLEDLLNLLNIGRAFSGAIPADTLEAVEGGVVKMTGWLRGMTLPDGGFPLFNDAAMNVAASRGELEDYAARLGVEVPEERTQETSELFEPSGFAVLRNPEAALFAETGGPGPAYQPGHCHAGTLGFELYRNGLPVVVDTGTSTYDPSPVRSAERSTRSHNTLCVEDRDSSEVWSAFRIARRATGRVLEWDPGAGRLKAEHNGYQILGLAGGHVREWRVGPDGVTIEDRIRLRRRGKVAVRFHFHPSVWIKPSGGRRWTLRRGDVEMVLEGDGNMEYGIEEGFHCAGFGKRVGNKVLVGESAGRDMVFRHCFAFGETALERDPATPWRCHR